MNKTKDFVWRSAERGFPSRAAEVPPASSAASGARRGPVALGLALVAQLTIGAIAGCGDDGGTITELDGGVATHALFALAADPMEFGAIPFPDDLYLGDDGRIDLATYPNQEAAGSRTYPLALLESLSTLDGFGAVSPAYFSFDGALDVSSLPASPAAAAAASASAFLIDIDPSSADRLARVPADVRFLEERDLLAIRPAEGHPLAPGRRYAAVVTSAVLDVYGVPVAPAEDFAALRDASAAPTDALMAEAYAEYAPVLDALEGGGRRARRGRRARGLHGAECRRRARRPPRAAPGARPRPRHR